MWNWLKRFLGLEITAKDIEREKKGIIILTGKVTKPTEIGPIPPTPEPSRADIRTRERDWTWSSDTPRKPPSLLELSKRRNPPSSTERKMPGSFTSRPGVKQAQTNLGKVGYKRDAKIEEDPPRRRRW